MIKLSLNKKKYINLDYNGVIPQSYSLIKSKLNYFPCGEFEFSVQEDLCNEEVIIFQSFSVGSFNDDLMKLQIACDVLNRNKVKSITYVSPFLPYMRQNKGPNNISLASKLIAEIINKCKISEVITYDLHTAQIENFFKCKISHRSMLPNFIEDIKSKFNENEIIIVFPDAGSTLRFKKFFIEEKFKIVSINKVRSENEIKMEILGDIKDKKAIIIDDIIDQGGTIIEAAKLLLENNCSCIFSYATHGIFSSNAIEKIENSSIEKIIVSNSLKLNKIIGKIEYIEIKI